MKQHISAEYHEGFQLAQSDIEIWGKELAKFLFGNLYSGNDWFATGYRHAVESAK